MTEELTIVDDVLPVNLESLKLRAQALITAGGAKVIVGLQLQNIERTTALFDELLGKARDALPGRNQHGMYGLTLRCSEVLAKNHEIAMEFSKAVSAAAIGSRAVESTFGKKLESKPVLPPATNPPELPSEGLQAPVPCGTSTHESLLPAARGVDGAG